MPINFVGVNGGNGWKNSPNTGTPLNEANLNIDEAGIRAACDGVDDINTKISKKIQFTPLADATVSPTATVSAGGNVDAGTHYYLITFVNPDGETGFTALAPTPTTAVTTSTNKTVTLSNIPLGGTGTTARKIYRMSSLQPLRYYVLLATISNNTATTYVDTAADSSLPTSGMQSKWNTTSGKIMIGETLAGYVGESNTLLGLRGLQALTTGFDNTGIGMGVLSGMTSGYNNSAVGANALWANTTGINNTGMGVHALQNNTTGGGNTGIGVYTLQNNNGYNNTGVGVGALQNNTSGEANVAVGVNAMLTNTTGTQDVAIGAFAMQNTTTGYGDVAIGWETLKANTTGFNNTAIGKQSMLSNMDGYNNTGVGLGSLQSNVSGSANVAIGVNSLLLSNNAGNVGVGFSAGSVITSGNNNTFIGNNAGQNASQLATAYRSTAIGSGAYTTESDTMQLGDTNLTKVLTHGSFETQDIGDGFICKSPDGTRYKIAVANGGAIAVTAA